MNTLPAPYKTHVIVPIASWLPIGYVASVLITGPTGNRRSFGILGYFTTEKAACEFAMSYAMAQIDGTTLPGPPSISR